MVKSGNGKRQYVSTHTARRRQRHIPTEREMFLLIKRFFGDQSGATAMEYAMLVVFIGLAIAVGAQALGGGMSNLLNNGAGTLNNVIIPTPPAP